MVLSKICALINKMSVVFLIILLTAVEIVAELLLNAQSKQNKYGLYFYGGVAGYVAVAYVFARAMRQDPDNIGIINTVWQVANIASMLVISYFFLRETFKPIQLVGGVLAVASGTSMVVGEFN